MFLQYRADGARTFMSEEVGKKAGWLEKERSQVKNVLFDANVTRREYTLIL